MKSNEQIYKVSYQYRSLAYNQRVRFLIIHYTAENFCTSIKKLTNELSAHYLVPDPSEKDYPYSDLRIFNLVDEKNRAWHAGISSWENRNNLNDQSIGIEIVNLSHESHCKIHFVSFNEKQIDAVIQLGQNIITRYPDIVPTRIIGHSDIAPDRKLDPGPLFPWKKLYNFGIGAWYDENIKEKYIAQYTKKGLPSISDIQVSLSKYGYSISNTKIFDNHTKNVLRSFQMHFRPSKYTGQIDIETAAIIAALLEKYSI